MKNPNEKPIFPGGIATQFGRLSRSTVILNTSVIESVSIRKMGPKYELVD